MTQADIKRLGWNNSVANVIFVGERSHIHDQTELKRLWTHS